MIDPEASDLLRVTQVADELTINHFLRYRIKLFLATFHLYYLNLHTLSCLMGPFTPSKVIIGALSLGILCM